MGNPIPIPPRQDAAFQQAVAHRLGLNLEEISDNFRATFEVMGGEELGEVKVSFSAYLPAQEILDMFNGAGRPS